MTIETFGNLPVKDLKKSVDFFTNLGFSFNKQYTNEKGACMIINKESFYMLLTEDFFKSFINKDIVNTSTAVEVINSLGFDKRIDVDVLAEKAFTLGARKWREPEDMGFMYTRTFIDLDGHHWEFVWMDPNYEPNK